jgi:hypothetical protein
MEKMQQKIRLLDPGGASQAENKKRVRKRRTTREKNAKRSRRRDIGNPSACFVELEYGPGRIDDEAKNKPRDGSFIAERRKEIPHELESTPKITPKMKISDST